MKIIVDKVGLKNLNVAYGTDTCNFIFDTGANLSVVPITTAKRFNMTIIPTSIEVGNITGATVMAQLAVCSKFSI